MKNYTERAEMYKNGIVWESVDYRITHNEHMGSMSIIKWFEILGLKLPSRLNWYNHDSGRHVESFKVSTKNTTGEDTYDFYVVFTDSFGNYRANKFTADTQAEYDAYDYTKERFGDNRFNEVGL